jgi:hypothetical protein
MSDSTEKKYWLERLNKGLNQEQVIKEFLSRPEYWKKSNFLERDHAI